MHTHAHTFTFSLLETAGRNGCCQTKGARLKVDKRVQHTVLACHHNQ